MNPNTASSGQQQQQQQQNGVGNQMAAPDTSAFLRRRSGQITDSPPSHPHQPGTPIGTLANRRAAAGRAMTQNDWSLSLTSLSTPPNTPPMTSTSFTRTTTPTPSASSPLTTPFGKRRAADEIKAVTDMLNGVTDTAEIGNNAESSSTTSGIQRPASAPPRGRRSRRPSRELNDAGVDAMEKAPPLPTTKEVPTSITGIASETIEQFAAHLSDRSLALLFLFIVAWGAVLSLDRLTTYSYQTIATNSFSHHSALAEVNVIRSVVAAVAALPFATIADLGGRAQAFTIGLVLYAAGHAAMAGSTSIPSYVGGVILYESGANGLVCLQATVLADMTSSRNRLFFQIVPQMPFLVFSFISSDIYSAILPRWRWGIGMFAILGPAALLPVIAILGNSQKQSGSSNVSVNSKSSNNSPSQSMRRASLQQCESALSYTLLMIKHVWQTSDVLGLLLMVASLCLTLIPLTIAASSPDQWESPKILGMISAGLVAIFLFSMWELRMAKNPLIPRVLLQNRTFWGGALALTSLWAAHELMLAYFPTYLYVVHGVSNRAQQNFSVIYSFTVAAASLPIALMVRHSRRFKVFTIVGVVIFTAGLGMMIGYKGTADSRFEIASSQAIIGLGGALTIALIQAAVQVSVTPTFVAQSIAALNIFPSIGTAIGAAIAGAMWTGLLPGKLARNLTPTGHLNELPTIYAEPLTWIESNGLGTSTRTAVVNAYTSCWRTMMITATLICALSLVPILYTENLKLNDSLSAEEAIGEEEVAYSGAIKPSKMVTKGGGLFGDSLFERMENALGRTLVRRVPKKVLPDSPTDIKTSDMSMMASTSSTSSSSSHLTVPGKMNGSSTNREKSNQKSRWSNAWGALRGPSLGGGGNGKMNNSISSVMEGGIESLHIPTPTLIVDHGTPSPTSPQDTSIPAPILVVDEPPNDSPLQIPTPPGSRGSIGSLSPLPSPLTSFKSLSPNRGEEK